MGTHQRDTIGQLRVLKFSYVESFKSEYLTAFELVASNDLTSSAKHIYILNYFIFEDVKSYLQ